MLSWTLRSCPASKQSKMWSRRCALGAWSTASTTPTSFGCMDWARLRDGRSGSTELAAVVKSIVEPYERYISNRLSFWFRLPFAWPLLCDEDYGLGFAKALVDLVAKGVLKGVTATKVDQCGILCDQALWGMVCRFAEGHEALAEEARDRVILTPRPAPSTMPARSLRTHTQKRDARAHASKTATATRGFPRPRRGRPSPQRRAGHTETKD